MKEKHAISSLGYLLADPGRTAMLLALLEGRSLPAGELARAASVSAQSASAHLAKLSRGGLITVQREGRCRYYKLAGQRVANALEALGAALMQHFLEENWLARNRDSRALRVTQKGRRSFIELGVSPALADTFTPR